MVTYDELSTLIGTCPDLAIVRRFGTLAAQVILRMQAELSELEDDFKALANVELKHPHLQEHAKSWEKANQAVEAGEPSIRKEKSLEAEEKLGRYCTVLAIYLSPTHRDRMVANRVDEFISRTASVLRLGNPDSCDIKFLRSWIQNEKYGNDFLKRSSNAEARAWDDSHENDLMALSKREDRFVAWIANNIVPIYHTIFGHRWQKRIEDDALGVYYAYDDKKLLVFGNLLCTILSMMIPSSSILVLYYVESMVSRLLLIIAFSSLFSLVMGFVAQGRRYEMFTATVAFAAVQVVFVGGVTGQSNN
jgi:hypothetical protein